MVTSSAVVGSSAMRISRLAGERQRDHRALAHAAGELVRILPGAALGVGHLHQPQRLDGARERLARPTCGAGARASAICSPIVITGLSAVSGSWKIMAICSPRRSSTSAPVHGEEVLAVDPMIAAGDARRLRQQPQQRQRGHRLAAAASRRRCRASRPARPTAPCRRRRERAALAADLEFADRRRSRIVEAPVSPSLRRRPRSDRQLNPSRPRCCRP